ncbi:MAG: hypothetical protein U0836_03490 [Pirellulales bacterium]
MCRRAVCRLALGGLCLLLIPTEVRAESNSLFSYELRLSEDLALLSSPHDARLAERAVSKSANALAVTRNNPYVRLTNTSASAPIQSFQLSIGDAANAVFDALQIVGPPAGTTARLLAPTDAVQGGARAQVIEFVFDQGLAPGRSLTFQLDIDPVKAGMLDKQDFRHILFDLGGNDSSDNARVSVVFNADVPDGVSNTLTTRLPDYSLTTGQFNVTENVVAQQVVQEMPEGCCPTEPCGVFIVSHQAVPEPATVWLALGGAGTLAVRGIYRRAKRSAVCGKS